MNAFLEALVALQTRLHAFHADRDERGQGTLEYVGMVIVAALLVMSVLQVTGQVDLGGVFSAQIDKIKNFGG